MIWNQIPNKKIKWYSISNKNANKFIPKEPNRHLMLESVLETFKVPFTFSTHPSVAAMLVTSHDVNFMKGFGKNDDNFVLSTADNVSLPKCIHKFLSSAVISDLRIMKSKIISRVRFVFCVLIIPTHRNQTIRDTWTIANLAYESTAIRHWNLNPLTEMTGAMKRWSKIAGIIATRVKNVYTKKLSSILLLTLFFSLLSLL